MTTHTEQRGAGAGRHVPESFEVEHRRQLELEREELRALGEPFEAAWPVARDCSTRYRALRDSGTRSVRDIRFGIIHSTECAHAITAAAWFADPRSEGSAHVVVDARECYRTLAPSRIPWAAPSANAHGWHLEIAGYARWSSATWNAGPMLLERAAYKLAFHGHAYGFPMVRLTVGELRAGRRGIADHFTVTQAFGGTHHDVGPGFPWARFLTLARRFELELKK